MEKKSPLTSQTMRLSFVLVWLDATLALIFFNSQRAIILFERKFFSVGSNVLFCLFSNPSVLISFGWISGDTLTLWRTSKVFCFPASFGFLFHD